MLLRIALLLCAVCASLASAADSANATVDAPPIHSDGVAQDNDDTCTMLETIRFLWTINNVTIRSEQNEQGFTSRSFPLSSKAKPKWALTLYPQGSTSANYGYLDVMLCLIVEDPSQEDFQAKVRFSIPTRDYFQTGDILRKGTDDVGDSGISTFGTENRCYVKYRLLSGGQLYDYLWNGETMHLFTEIRRLSKGCEEQNANSKQQNKQIILNPCIFTDRCTTTYVVDETVPYHWEISNARRIFDAGITEYDSAGFPATLTAPYKWEMDIRATTQNGVITDTDTLQLNLCLIRPNAVIVNALASASLLSNLGQPLVKEYPTVRAFQFKGASGPGPCWGWPLTTVKNFLDFYTIDGNVKIDTSVIRVKEVTSCPKTFPDVLQNCREESDSSSTFDLTDISQLLPMGQTANQKISPEGAAKVVMLIWAEEHDGKRTDEVTHKFVPRGGVAITDDNEIGNELTSSIANSPKKRVSIMADLLVLAQRNSLSSLKHFCEKLLFDELNVDTVVPILRAAYEGRSPYLKQEGLLVAAYSQQQVERLPEWNELIKAFPKVLEELEAALNVD